MDHGISLRTQTRAAMPESVDLGAVDQFERRSGRDLAETMMDAGRKRRILNEALDRRLELRGNAILTAAGAGFAAALANLAMVLDVGRWVYLVPTALLLGLLSGSTALLILVLNRRGYWDALAADTARCSIIIRQIQALREEDLRTPLGRRVLDGLLQEFKTIVDGRKALDSVDFVVERRHRRLKVRHTNVICILPDGERRPATIRDISRSGVALTIDVHLPVGTALLIGSTPARAVRVTEDGLAFEFLKPIPRERFSQDIVL